MMENPAESGIRKPKEAVPHFEVIADALSDEDKERFDRLSEQVSDIMASHGGRIDYAQLTSAERELVDEHAELRKHAFENIAMSE